ncbi:WbqC family protein [Aliarcobacter butzleri]|uniref:WbqC family protein n=1 Tax=Aliarcobacter butzleri TaxID=28197 RepID=UPI003B2105F5
MKKTVVIHQPDFLPYLGFFHRLLYADLFVILDDVQFIKSGWHNRDQIKVPYGSKKIWITLSVHKTKTDTNINQVTISMDSKGKQKFLNQIIENYRKSKYFKEIEPLISRIILNEENNLSLYNINIIKELIKIFDIDIEIIIASTLNHVGKANDMNVDILKKVKATHYLSGVGAKDYHDDVPFEKENIEVIWQDFKHPVYPQLYGEFIPYLSSIDLLFNCGIEKSREILRSI